MLPALEGFAVATLESLDRNGVTTVARDLASLEQTVLANADLRGVLSDTSITGPVRAAIVRDLLAGKLSAPSARLASYAAAHCAAQAVTSAIGELAHACDEYVETGTFPLGPLSLLEARRRVFGYADAHTESLESSQFSAIEDELFRWARTVEANQVLRRALLDRDAPLASRLGLTDQLLSGKVNPATLSLARFVVIGGRPRDVVGTLDALVDYVARSRDWRVARVHSARALDDASQRELVASLSSLTGKSVELQVAQDDSLLGGILVEVGDLRLDASTKGRLGALRDAVAATRLAPSVLNRND
jgi:F-type H+-transporting ATPase subunit delta